MAVYLASFYPIHALLPESNSFLSSVWVLHERMWEGMKSLSQVNHPYRSAFWQWPLLFRPMWYSYELAGEEQVRCVFASGNPALFWSTFPLLFWVVKTAFQKTNELSKKARVLGMLFWVSYFFWIAAPRSTQYFYYYFLPSLWLGPIFVLYFSKLDLLKLGFVKLKNESTKKRVLVGFTLLCAVLFFHFLPVFDAREIPRERYLIYMWFRSWI